MTDPAAQSTSPPRTRRRVAVALLALAALLAVAWQGWHYRRLLGGDPFAVHDLVLWRPLARRAVRTADTGLGRAMAVRALQHMAHLEPLAPADVAALRAACADPSPVVRATALDALLGSLSAVPAAEALERLAAALEDEAPLDPDETARLDDHSARWAILAALHREGLVREGRPPAPFTPALHAAFVLHALDDPPALVLSSELFAEEARRRAVSAAVPPPFTQRRAAWPTAAADARALAGSWRAHVAARAEPPAAEPASALARLRPLLAGHPTHDPARHVAALEAAARAP